MQAYLTWGIGFGKHKELAQINAQLDARLDKIKVEKLEKLEIPLCNVYENKKELENLKGNYKGIVLQNCAKGEVASALVLCFCENKIIIGHGKAGGAIKAENIAKFKAFKLLTDQKLKENMEQRIIITAHAPPQKDTYGCAIVALIFKNEG
ncbi:MAG: hypothetical protein QXQ79_01040 [Candidatus Nanoarchaeia archaeon]